MERRVWSVAQTHLCNPSLTTKFLSFFAQSRTIYRQAKFLVELCYQIIGIIYSQSPLEATHSPQKSPVLQYFLIILYTGTLKIPVLFSLSLPYYKYYTLNPFPPNYMMLPLILTSGTYCSIPSYFFSRALGT